MIDHIYLMLSNSSEWISILSLIVVVDFLILMVLFSNSKLKYFNSVAIVFMSIIASPILIFLGILGFTLVFVFITLMLFISMLLDIFQLIFIKKEYRKDFLKDLSNELF